MLGELGDTFFAYDEGLVCVCSMEGITGIEGERPGLQLNFLWCIGGQLAPLTYSHSLGAVFAIYFFPSRILGHLMKKSRP